MILLGPASTWAQAQSGTITEYAVPAAGSHPQAITGGPDGAIWFTDPGTNSIGQLAPSGSSFAITEYPIPTPSCGPVGITQGVDGALWFTEQNANKIGRITTSGAITEYPLPTPFSAPTTITFGSDSGVWFTEANANQIGNIGPSGVIKEYLIPTPAGTPVGIVWATDRAVWFTEYNGNKIGRIATSGVITEYAIPTPQSGPLGIGLDRNLRLWFSEYGANQIGNIATSNTSTSGPPAAPPGVVTEYPLPIASSGPTGSTGACFTLSNANTILCDEDNFKEYPIPTPASNPQGIAFVQNISASGWWFVEAATGKLGRLLQPDIPQLVISTSPTLPPGTVGQPYSVSLSAGGGVPPYTWSVIPGSLPAGLTLSAAAGSATAAISGIPTVSGPQAFAVSVSDADSTTAAETFTMQIGAATCTFALSSSGESFPAVGGSGNLFVTTQPGCPWTVSGAPNWVQGASGGTGSGPVHYSVNANGAAAPQTATLVIGGQTFTIAERAGPVVVPFCPLGNCPSLTTFMPHFTTQGGWRTDFTLVNRAAAATEVWTSFYDDNGNLLAIPVTTPQQSAPVMEAWVDQTLAPNQSATFETAGPIGAPFMDGSFQVSTLGSVDQFAILHNDAAGQAAPVPPGGSGLIIPFDNTGGIQTGIVVTNEAGAATYAIVLVDDNGVPLGTESIALPAGGHTWIALSTQFPETANVRGTAILGSCSTFAVFGPIESTVCTSLSTLAIRYTSIGTLTTLPALGTAAAANPLVIPEALPYFATGGGWQTTFVLSNTNRFAAPAAQQAGLSFFDANGNPLTLPVTFPQTGATATTASVSQTIPTNGTLLVQTPALVTGPLIAGSAQITGASGFAILTYNLNARQEIVLPMQTQSNSLLAFDNTNGAATLIALSNPSAQTASVPVVIRNAQGGQIGSDVISLAANGSTSFDLATKYPSAASIHGTIEFDVPILDSGYAGGLGVAGISSTPALTFAALPALLK